MNLKSILVVFWLLFLLAGCRKEDEVRAELEPGRLAGVSAYRFLSVLHIGQEMVKGRNSGFLTQLVRITLTDSSYADGDGIKYALDFKKGVVCGDGILRKGRLTVEVIDTALPGFRFKMICLATDSFAVSAKTGWEFVTGSLELNSENTQSASLHFALQYSAENGLNLHRDSTSQSKPLEVNFSQPFFGGKSGIVINGKWFLNGNTVTAAELTNSGSCFSNWNKGKLTSGFEKQTVNVDFDPYGNEACDQVFKVTYKNKRIADEMIFDAW